MEPPATPTPPPPHNNCGRGQGGAPRGWELLRNLQVRPLRRPYSGPIAEAMNNQNPGRYRGGGVPLEFVRGGMGRGRRPNYFINRGGRGGRGVQNTNSLGAMPDCVPEASGGYPHHSVLDDTQQSQEEPSGAMQREDPVNDMLSQVHISDSGISGVQNNLNHVPLQSPASDMTGGHSLREVNINETPHQPPTNDLIGGNGGGRNNINQMPHQPPMNDMTAENSVGQTNVNQPLQPPVIGGNGGGWNNINHVPHQPPANNRNGGQEAMSPMQPIPVLRSVTTVTETIVGQHSVSSVAPIPLLQPVAVTAGAGLPHEQNAQRVPTTAFLPNLSGIIPLSQVCISGIVPVAGGMLPNMTQGIFPNMTQVLMPNAVQSKPQIIEVESILERSKLSPNAKEFIPLSKQAQSSQLAGTNTQGELALNSNDRENGLNYDQIATAGDGASTYQDRTEDDLLENWSFTEMVETLQLVQFELVKHPANFNNMMRNITPALVQWLKSNLVVPMVELIIGMATQQDNFGYMATKMCVYVSNLDPSNVFRTSLIERCHDMCQNISEERKSATFLGFVMFLAELYVQFKNERGQRVDVIGTGLLECLENLISEPVVCNNLKFFCNALKLAGYYLDTDLKSAMNQLMTHIQSVMTAVGLDNIDKRIYNQLQKLIDMRNNNWDNQGATSSESQEEQDDTSDSNSATHYSDAVFYGPDGQVLTLEESQFLTENQSLTECMLQKENQSESYDEDSSKEDSGDSMDEEMQDAFEQFLQMVPEQH